MTIDDAETIIREMLSPMPAEDHLPFSKREAVKVALEAFDIVQAVADGVVMTVYDSGRDVYVCSGCEREVDGFFTDEELAGESVYEHVQPFIVHKPTCIVLTARQLLGK